MSIWDSSARSLSNTPPHTGDIEWNYIHNSNLPEQYNLCRYCPLNNVCYRSWHKCWGWSIGRCHSPVECITCTCCPLCSSKNRLDIGCRNYQSCNTRSLIMQINRTHRCYWHADNTPTHTGNTAYCPDNGDSLECYLSRSNTYQSQHPSSNCPHTTGKLTRSCTTGNLECPWRIWDRIESRSLRSTCLSMRCMSQSHCKCSNRWWLNDRCSIECQIKRDRNPLGSRCSCKLLL